MNNSDFQQSVKALLRLPVRVYLLFGSVGKVQAAVGLAWGAVTDRIREASLVKGGSSLMTPDMC